MHGNGLKAEAEGRRAATKVGQKGVVCVCVWSAELTKGSPVTGFFIAINENHSGKCI
jgi:hypothetical protein